MPIVKLDAEEMAADLVLVDGERLASANMAIVMLARNGVKHGLLHAELATLPSKPGPIAIRVAIGEPPLPGVDGRVYYAFPLSGGRMSLEPPSIPPTVVAGEIMARRHPASSGQLGRTVTGRTLPIPPVYDPPFAAGEGAELSMDGDFIVATWPGVPHLVGDAVVVRPLLRVAGDLGADDAPIVAGGDVVVEGHVEHPASIEATGDVHVLGGVQGAHIRAGGRIYIHGGVRQEALLEAGGEIGARFVEQSTLRSGATVAVREDAIRSVIEASRAIIGGSVVGGDLTLVEWLDAGTLGSEFAPATRIAVVPPPPPEDDGKAIARERREVAEQLTRLGPLLDENRRLAKDPRNESAREMAAKLVGLIAHLQSRDRDLAARAAEAPEPPSSPRPYVRVRGMAYPGVSLQVGAQFLRPSSPIPASAFLEGMGAVEIAPHDLELERILT